MAQYNASVVFSFVDKMSSASRKAFAGMTSGVNTLRSGIDQLASGSKYLQTAANLSLVSQQFSSMSTAVRSLVDKPSEVATAFESGMARVSTVLTATNAINGDVASSQQTIADAARAMAGGINQAGKLAAIGMNDFASSVYTMLSSGLNVKEAVAATEQASLLAKATGGNLADAASTITGVFNNLGDKSANAGEEMRRLSDIIAGTQNHFAFEDLNQFTQGLKTVSGAAIGFGVPLTQVAATVGQLNTNMITGAQAGTAMKSILAQLGNASKRLGFDIAKTDDGGVDLVNTLANIATTGADGAAMTKAFGTEAGPAVSVLVSNLTQLKAGYDAVGNSAGITLQNAAKMADTLAEKQTRLSTATQVFQQRMGAGANAVKGFGTDMALLGVRALNAASDLPLVGGAVSGLIGAFAQAGGASFGFLNSIMQVTSGLASFMWLGEKLPAMLTLGKGAFTLLRSSIFTAIPALITWTAGVISAAAAHVVAFAPIYAIVAAVAAVGAAVFFAIKHWDAIWVVLKSFGSWLTGVFAGTWQIISTAMLPFTIVPSIIMKNWAPIADFFTGIFQKISNVINIAGSFIGKLFGNGAPQPIAVTPRFAGGIANAGSTYLVGEQGPELFTPQTTGTVINNSQTKNLLNQQTNPQPPITINIDTISLSLPDSTPAQSFVDQLLQVARDYAL